MIFKDINKVNRDGENFYYGIYKPYWRYLPGGRKVRNYQFDRFSEMILELKRNNYKVIRYFSRNIDPLLCSGIAIATVPPHSFDSAASGIQTLGLMLSRNNRINAVFCLERYTDITPLSSGGNRDASIHLRSIRLKDSNLIKKKGVLLLDDVCTTGHSLQACSQILIEGGAEKVQCFAIGLTAKY